MTRPCPRYRQRPAEAPDVAAPQANNLAYDACHSVTLSDRMILGRTQAACASIWGRAAGNSSALTFQEYRSRGCRPALKPLSPFALLPSWQPVRRKKNPFTSTKARSRLSRPIPANTSNGFGRTTGAVSARSAHSCTALFDAAHGFGHLSAFLVERGMLC